MGRQWTKLLGWGTLGLGQLWMKVRAEPEDSAKLNYILINKDSVILGNPWLVSQTLTDRGQTNETCSS